MIRTCAIVDVVGDKPDWPIESLRLGGFTVKDGGGLYFPPAFDGTLTGWAVIRFLRQFNAVIFWHWPGERVIRAIREAPAMQHGTRIGLACCFESINQSEPWDGRQNILWQVSRAHLLRSQTPNSRGEYTIDYYEAEPASNKNHSWAVDIGAPGYAESYAECLSWALDIHYPAHRPDFLFVDCLQERRFWGSATNPVEEMPSRYVVGHESGIEAIQGRLLPVWGHNPGNGYSRVLKMRMDEFAWQKTPDELAAQTILFANRGNVVGLGFDNKRPECYKRPWWEEFYGRVRNQREHQIYVVTARTGSAFAIFCPGSDIVETP